jgi:hypothetical protein
MKVQKKVSMGSFLKKGEDIKDKDVVEIASEGKEVEGQFGMQNLFLVKTQDGKEGNVSFNQTTLNNLVDGYGDETKNWIGKPARVWAILSNVQGKMIKVYYFLHPDADIDEGGIFVLKNPTAPVPMPKGTLKEGDPGFVSVEEIPF